MKSRRQVVAAMLGALGLPSLFTHTHAAAQDNDAGASGTPPARVGQLWLQSGSARLRVDRSARWESAALNTPISSGSALATESPARAEVRIGSTTLRVAMDAQVVFTEVSDDSLQLQLNHGLFALRVLALATGERLLISAGAATVQVLRPGAYRFRLDGPRVRLRFWVLDGQAKVAYGTQEQTLGPQQQLQLDRATPSPLTASASEEHASFHEFVDERERRTELSLALQHVSAEVTGAEALDGNGHWRDEAGYGVVWFPSKLPADWAPFRFGRWRWLAAWGWTWIDDAPWGFATSHYGRWLFQGGRWGWVPGALAAPAPTTKPVYAPALVGFFGPADGAVFTPAGGSTPVVGWYPLAPGEIYWPAYSTQMAYVRALNASSVSSSATLQSLPAASAAGPAHRYARTAFAATAMPHAAFISMQNVASLQVPWSPAALAQAPLAARRWPPAAPPPAPAAPPPASTK